MVQQVSGLAPRTSARAAFQRMRKQHPTPKTCYQQPQPQRNVPLEGQQSNLFPTNTRKEHLQACCMDTTTIQEFRSSHSMSRRRAVERGIGTTVFVSCSIVEGTEPVKAAEPARQLELCLVSLLRTLYWAQNLSLRMRTAQQAGSLQGQREAYLEARLGAKAILTSGGRAQGLLGSPPTPMAAQNLYILSTLQLPACLRDLQTAYNPNNNVLLEPRCQDLKEALASLVEFDGMDTLQDPSPRSSLTLSQWNDKKQVYVQRLLDERIVFLSQQILNSYPSQPVETSRNYIQRYYPDEAPPPPPPSPPPRDDVSQDEASPSSSTETT